MPRQRPSSFLVTSSGSKTRADGERAHGVDPQPEPLHGRYPGASARSGSCGRSRWTATAVATSSSTTCWASGRRLAQAPRSPAPPAGAPDPARRAGAAQVGAGRRAARSAARDPRATRRRGALAARRRPGGAVVWAMVERRAAQEAREQARSGELAASAVAQLALDPERSVLLARKAWSTAPTAAADAALRRSLSASHVRDRFGVGAPSNALLTHVRRVPRHRVIRRGRPYGARIPEPAGAGSSTRSGPPSTRGSRSVTRAGTCS